MAQANPEEKPLDHHHHHQQHHHHHHHHGLNNNNNSGGFKFNAQAAEFIPRSHHTRLHLHSPVNNNNHSNHNNDENNNANSNSNSNSNNNEMAISGYFYPCLQFVDGAVPNASATPSVTPADWFYVNAAAAAAATTATQDHPQQSFSLFPHSLPSLPNSPRNNIHDDLQLKIIKQVEYLFSDLSLMANDTMAKHVSKDPEGYVPIPVIASMKKIKALLTDHHLLLQALRLSTKLVVSKDSKKVKRRSPFTENYKDELQCRIVIVENLPEDHSYQNLEKIFSVVGSVKAIRLCHPPEANPSRSKNDVIISNKLHALVEYENAEIAERAAERLNDERNWRKGMRVRVMLRRSPKSVLKGRKPDFDILTDDEEAPPPESPEETSQLNGADYFGESIVEENCCGSRKGSVRGRGKSKSRIQCHSGRGLLASPTQMVGSPFQLQCDASTKQMNKGPRMPDGSRGFTMGRGKLMRSCSAPTSTVS